MKFDELQRRHVLRAVGVYLVAFWVVLQITDVVGPSIGLADWVMRFVLISGIIALPFVFALAWFYDFSRHGLIRTPAATSSPAQSIPKDRKAYELYLRANQLSVQAGDWTRARDMYLEALSLDDTYAPAWARLGRCYRLLAKYAPDLLTGEQSLRDAENAFERALALDPELSMTHSLFAQLEIDLGRAEEAMVRLLARSQVAGADAEIFAGLVQACRFCGLLDASVASFERARRLEPHIRTSIAHTYFMQGRYEDALGEYNNADIGYLEALALAMLGREREAIALLAVREKAQRQTLVGPYLASLRAVLEGDRDRARALIEEALSPRSIGRDGEAVYYMARQCVRIGDTGRALELLDQTVERGFFCAPVFASDPWLDPLRDHEAFHVLTIRVQTRHRQAVVAFNQTGGGTLLGDQPNQSSSLMPSGSLNAT